MSISKPHAHHYFTFLPGQFEKSRIVSGWLLFRIALLGDMPLYRATESSSIESWTIRRVSIAMLPKFLKSPYDHESSFLWTFSQWHRTWLPLATFLLVIVGGCTAEIYPPPPDHTIQEKKTQPIPKLGNAKTEPHQASVKEEPPPDIIEQVETNRAIARGRKVYREHCMSCHGMKGDGQGKVAKDLSTKPRDLTKGVYKFRSTPSGLEDRGLLPPVWGHAQGERL